MEERWSYRITTLAGLLDKQSARRFARYGLNLVQWRILTSVTHFGPCSMTEILPMAAVDRALVSREVANLQKAGFLSVTGDLHDKRKKVIALTASGVAKHAEMLPEVIARHAFIEACMSDVEKEIFGRVIDKLKVEIAQDLQRGHQAGG